MNRVLHLIRRRLKDIGAAVNYFNDSHEEVGHGYHSPMPFHFNASFKRENVVRNHFSTESSNSSFRDFVTSEKIKREYKRFCCRRIKLLESFNHTLQQFE